MIVTVILVTIFCAIISQELLVVFSRIPLIQVKEEKFRSISVLLVVRDEIAGIEKCIDSLLQQDHPDFDIYVMDDRSVDGTQDIIRSYEGRINFTVSTIDPPPGINPKACTPSGA